MVLNLPSLDCRLIPFNSPCSNNTPCSNKVTEFTLAPFTLLETAKLLHVQTDTLSQPVALRTFNYIDCLKPVAPDITARPAAISPPVSGLHECGQTGRYAYRFANSQSDQVSLSTT